MLTGRGLGCRFEEMEKKKRAKLGEEAYTSHAEGNHDVAQQGSGEDVRQEQGGHEG